MNWLRRLFSQGRLERELDAELRFHFDRAVEDAMRSGLSEAEARRAARLQWGGAEQVKEECRDERAPAWLTGSLADVRIAWRGVRKSPVFAAAAVGVLALGIGGDTAIFSVVNATFLRPLPYRDAERLVFATERLGAHVADRVPPPEISAWTRTGIFESLAGDYQGMRTDIAAPGRAPELTGYTRVTTNFFYTLGVAPQLGRDFLPDECEPGRGSVALVSDQLWRSSFGASSAAIGATVLVDSAPYTVVGVLPRGFAFLGADPPDVITPVPTCPAGMATQRGGWLSVIGRLRPGIGVQQAQARLEAATHQLNAVQPDVFEYSRLRNPRDPNWVAVMPLQERLSGNHRTSLAVMMGVAVCTLLIVCANVANLFLARAMTREREVAMRAALGASRPRLLRLLLIESLMLSALGGALGVALAYIVAPALRFLLPQAIRLGTPLDWRALVFTAAATVGAALIVGLAPALAASRVDLGAAMKDGGAPKPARAGRGLLRGSLAVAQLALSLALVVSAGLLLRSFVKLVRVDMGFNPQNVLATELKLRPYKAYDAARRAERFHSALAAVRALPGVEAVGLAASPPVTSMGTGAAYFRSDTGRSSGGYFNLNAASPGYFRAMQIPLLAGRVFTDNDDLSAPRVVILSQTAARRMFGADNPLGQRITYASLADKPDWSTVVGVVDDVRHRGYEAEPWAEVYWPVELGFYSEMSIVARSHIDPAALAPALRRAVQSADPAKKIPSVKRMDEMLSDSVVQRRQRAYLLGAFAALSLLVAMVGVYGVVAYSVARRTHEIGVRMALGAQPGDVLRMVLGEGLKLALAGAAIGLALSLWLSRALASFLFGVGPRDAVTFLAAGVTLAAAVCLASYVPARQATRVDPATALRRE